MSSLSGSVIRKCSVSVDRLKTT